MSDPLVEADGVRRYLSQGGRVLVVGARSSNFSESFRAHPRIVVWDSIDPVSHTRELPANVRVIVSTRFIGHQLYGRLHSLARRRHLLMVPGLRNTGEIKIMLEHALGMADASVLPLEDPVTPVVETETAPAATAALPKRTRGPLKAFILQHANLAAAVGQEATRLLPLAQQAGLVTTQTHLRQAISNLRHREKKLGTSPTPPAAAPARPASPPPSAPLLMHDTDDAVRMIDDAVAALMLAREAVLKLQAGERHTQETLRALRGFLDHTQL